MAAPIAAAAIETLVAMTVQQLANEASLIFSFKEDFEWVTRELSFMKDYLKDAHQKSTYNAVKRWLGELQDVVLDAEDIVDECAAESLSITFKYVIGRKIRNLKKRMKSIDADARRLQLLHLFAPPEQASISLSRAEQWKRSSLLESNARPVAIEAKVDEIIRLLHDDAHHVIAVVGMGGVGKTFLLQNVYEDSRTKGKFEKCIWLSISQTYSLQKLQADMASCLDLRDVVAGHLSEQRAAELIRGSLNGKNFLIVLDDVWRASEQDNLIERLGLPIANTECKIVFSTRSMEVCARMNASSIYRMQILKEEDSWDLFCVYAFCPDSRPPQHLKELARQVESKCGKLPLALKIVGASMANQTRAEQWESVLQKLKAVKKLDDPIMEILQLSYDFLPAHLKPCFLYFAFFGEDEEIDVEYLIELWIAEGFIPQEDDGRKIGLNYYYQLSNLCLVEAREDGFLWKSCKIHDLLLDLAIYICKENKCGFAFEKGCTKYSSFSRCRRIFLAKQGMQDSDISKPLFPTFLRTLSLRENYEIENIPSSLFSKVEALRVLDLSSTSISTLPSSFKCLKLLKVLNLSFTQMEGLPKCVRSLKNLRVLYMLYMRRTPRDRIKQVPDWVGELKCLEVLHMEANSMPKTILQLLSLRSFVLDSVELSVQGHDLLRLEDVGSLIGLQELTIEIHHEVELQRLEEGVLERLVNMRRLTVRNRVPKLENSDGPFLPEKLTSMKHLHYLQLESFIVPSSSWICEFVNLTVLWISGCECSEYPPVESLPNLISLQLWHNNKCREMRKSFGKCGAFSKLRFLSIHHFSMLEELPVLEEGSMPCLEEFSLIGCPKVRRVEGLEQLKSLKLLEFDGSGTDECRERLKEEGEEGKKIKEKNPWIYMSI